MATAVAPRARALITAAPGRQPVTQVASVTTMPRKPAASARETRLAARSRSVGVYSWKKPGVSPNRAATSSIGSAESVEAIMGTPVAAAAPARVDLELEATGLRGRHQAIQAQAKAATILHPDGDP